MSQLPQTNLTTDIDIAQYSFANRGPTAATCAVYARGTTLCVNRQSSCTFGLMAINNYQVGPCTCRYGTGTRYGHGTAFANKSGFRNGEMVKIAQSY